MTEQSHQPVLTNPDDIDVLLRDVGKFLSRWKTASLATVDDQGQPHAANIQFASVLHEDRIAIYYVSNDASAHSQHITRDGLDGHDGHDGLDGHVAMTIYAHVRRPDHIHGVQLHGRCEAIAPDTPAWDDAWRAYSDRFAFVKLPPLRQRVRAETFWRVTPTWLRFVDNRQGFGYKRECHLGG